MSASSAILSRSLDAVQGEAKLQRLLIVFIATGLFFMVLDTVDEGAPTAGSSGQTVVASSDIMGLLLRVVAARRHLESVERIPDRRRASADTLSARSPCPDR